MNRPHGVFPDSIAAQAELEIWQGIREDTRRRLIRVISVGFLYLLAALAVGAYLMVAVADAAGGADVLMSWYGDQLDTPSIDPLAWSYGGLAMVATIIYGLTLLLIHDKLPPSLCRIVGSMPWIGSTVRIVAVGEFCQSIYLSVLRSQTYGDAFARASAEVRHADLRRWSGDSSQRMESGQSLASVLQSSPIQDQPLFAAASLVANGLSANETVQVWHHAAAECHLLAGSRLERTTLIISATCLFVSVLIASFALLISVFLMLRLLERVMY